jgi:hypothetical protein
LGHGWLSAIKTSECYKSGTVELSPQKWKRVLMETPPIYEKVIHEDMNKFIQLRLVISEFRGIEYLHLRKYYMDFGGEWLASKEGVSMPLDLSNCREMFRAFIEVLSLAESKQILEEVFGETLKEIYTE